MVNVFKNTWDRPKNHSRYHKSNKKNEAKKDSAVRSLPLKSYPCSSLVSY